MVEQWLNQAYLPVAKPLDFQSLLDVCQKAKQLRSTAGRKKALSQTQGSRSPSPKIVIVSDEEQIKAMEDLIPMIKRSEPRARQALLKSMGMAGRDGEEAIRALEDQIKKMKVRVMQHHLGKGSKDASVS